MLSSPAYEVVATVPLLLLILQYSFQSNSLVSVHTEYYDMKLHWSAFTCDVVKIKNK